jgi:hypothetical protein
VEPSDSFLRNLYFAMSALCGSITALAYMKWKEMSRGEVALNVFLGLAFAFVVGPWIAHAWIGISENDARAICVISYMCGAGWPVIIPPMIGWLKRLVPGQDGQEPKP